MPPSFTDKLKQAKTLIYRILKSEFIQRSEQSDTTREKRLVLHKLTQVAYRK